MKTHPTNSLTYADSGVSIKAGNELVNRIGGFVKSTSRPGAEGKIGGFGGVFDLKSCGFKDPLLVAANDGVGTKLRIAIDEGIHDTVGIDLVAMCANDLIVQGAEPLFFLDYYACGKLRLDGASTVIKGIAAGCQQAGMVLLGGETAEMPGMYWGEDYDLAGFAVGAVERTQLLPRSNMKSGDAVLGIASDGLHSNGFSLVRRIIEIAKLRPFEKYPLDESLTLAQALLKPTRIYVKSIRRIAADTNVKALAHITGGGLPENLPRVLPDNLAAEINLSAIPVPEIFAWLSGLGNVSQSEMLTTFNCGVGMCVICDQNSIGSIKDELESSGETVFELGKLTEKTTESSVIFIGKLKDMQ